MTPPCASAPAARQGLGGWLVAGVVLAVLSEAIAGTFLALARNDVMGDTAATPDEFAWLEIAYTTFKFMGFIAAPWLTGRTDPWRALLASTAILGLASAAAAFPPSLHAFVAIRAVQGFAGGLLLVAGQALLFTDYPRARQPFLQAVFAMGSVVVPASVGPAAQGWLLDSHSWAWIAFGDAPIAGAAVGLLLLAPRRCVAATQAAPFDGLGFILLSASLACITYVCSQGSRWNWFDEPRIVWLSLAAGLSLLAFAVQQGMRRAPRLLDLRAFLVDDFAFAFVASFVAGAALFGSAYLIPAFAVSVLGFTPGATGFLLLPGGALFAAALLAAAYLIQLRRKPPIITVPFGILLLMIAVGQLSGSTAESGAEDMMLAILLRGAGLGFLFLSITIIAFSGLPASSVPSGIGLFNLGRQLGGLIGVSALQTLITHHAAQAQAIIAAHVTAGAPAVAARLAATTTMLMGQGMEADAASRAALQLLGRAVSGQSAVIAFDAAFVAVALLFVVAAPLVVAIKIGIGRAGKARRAARGTAITSSRAVARQ